MKDELTSSGEIDPEESKAIHLQEIDESIEREGYEISNAMEHCPNCFAKLIEESEPGRTLIVCPVCRTITKTIFRDE